MSLSKQYRYLRDGRRIWLKHVPDSGPAAIRFYAKTYRIANDLFNRGSYGAALNQVCTAQVGGVIFQSRDRKKNLQRAKLVARIWREQHA